MSALGDAQAQLAAAKLNLEALAQLANGGGSVANATTMNDAWAEVKGAIADLQTVALEESSAASQLAAANAKLATLATALGGQPWQDLTAYVTQLKTSLATVTADDTSLAAQLVKTKADLATCQASLAAATKAPAAASTSEGFSSGAAAAMTAGGTLIGAIAGFLGHDLLKRSFK